jgi:NADPH-dependent F420 reductase
VRVGILGGTGPAGSGLALRLAASGIEVVIGSRSAERAATKVQELTEKWSERSLAITPGENDAAARCDAVVVATPWDGACDIAVSVREHLRGKVVISMANALVKVGKEFLPLMPPRGSIAGQIQAVVPDALVAAAFQHLPAKELGDIAEPMTGDVLVCSDHPAAYEATAELVGKMPNLRPLNAGSLSAATPIEAMTAVLLGLNVRYKTRAGLKLTGIPDAGV